MQAYALFIWAVPLLLLSFTVFLLALGSLLVRRIGGGDAIFTIRLAVLALLITIGLGLLRCANYAGLAESLAFANITNIHLAWGLAGWVLLLVMGVSYQVIPMFHVTPSYPTFRARALSVAVFIALLVLTFFDGPVVQSIAVVCLAGAAMIYATFSIRLLSQRKRKVPDITVRFWRVSLSSLILAALLLTIMYFFADELFPANSIRYRIPVVIGVLMIYGFATSVIMGMLQKIVPFLSYLHLQRRCQSNFELLKTLPHMGKFVPESRSRWQFRLHCAALLVLLLSTVTGALAAVAAMLMAVDFFWLGLTLARATRLYRSTVRGVAVACSQSDLSSPGCT